jgi:8-oxo-dGTP pyrophosphatase MutT (NUDIX family)
MIETLRHQLTLPLPGLAAHSKMVPTGRTLLTEPPAGARLGAVMILLFDIDRKWNTLLIRRTDDGKAHGGQISFPGGAVEARDRIITDTALRECEEETGVRARDIDILGQLSGLYIHPSNFWVTPIVGYVPNLQHYKAAEKEVQEIIQTPLELLFNPAIKTERTVISSFPDRPPIHTPVYALDEDLLVWGATAMILSELEHLIVPGH